MSVLNRQIKMAALGVLLAASAVSAVRAPDVERMRNFYAECLRFDYCGTNGIVRPTRGILKEGRVVFDAYVRPDVVQRDISFYRALGRFEMLAYVQRPAEDRSEEIRQLLSSRAEVGDIEWLQYVSSVEYSLLRVVNSGVGTLGLQDIDRILPDSMFLETSPRSGISARIAAHRAFRNMIGIACALGEWKRTHGSYPGGLKELGIDGKWLGGIGGSKIEYEVRDGIWQLFSPGARGGKNKCKFNEYVPVMDAPGVRFWPQSSCLWLSSEYSAKRRRLYETGTLYDATSPCACKLERGCIVRQDRGPRVKAH